MSSRGHHYILVGFSEELDRRPLHFVEPLPATKICSACGFVSKVVGLLPCGHFLCKPCYQQCQRSEKVVCPLEGDACSGEEVTWVNHPSRSILEKQSWTWTHSRRSGVKTTFKIRRLEHKCGWRRKFAPKWKQLFLTGINAMKTSTQKNEKPHRGHDISDGNKNYGFGMQLENGMIPAMSRYDYLSCPPLFFRLYEETVSQQPRRNCTMC